MPVKFVWMTKEDAEKHRKQIRGKYPISKKFTIGGMHLNDDNKCSCGKIGYTVLVNNHCFDYSTICEPCLISLEDRLKEKIQWSPSCNIQ